MEKEIPERKIPHDEKSPERSDWSSDIEKRDYYYDDSTGYEVYTSDENDGENDDDGPVSEESDS